MLCKKTHDVCLTFLGRDLQTYGADRVKSREDCSVTQSQLISFFLSIGNVAAFMGGIAAYVSLIIACWKQKQQIFAIMLVLTAAALAFSEVFLK
jgi:hypothetical protein